MENVNTVRCLETLKKKLKRMLLVCNISAPVMIASVLVMLMCAVKLPVIAYMSVVVLFFALTVFLLVIYIGSKAEVQYFKEVDKYVFARVKSILSKYGIEQEAFKVIACGNNIYGIILMDGCTDYEEIRVEIEGLLKEQNEKYETKICIKLL